MAAKPSVEEWTPSDVAEWLKESKLGGLAQTFLANQINGQSLLELTDLDLADTLQIASLGKRKNVLRAIMQLKVKIARGNTSSLSGKIQSERSNNFEKLRVPRSAGMVSLHSSADSHSDAQSHSSFLINRKLSKTYAATKKLQLF